MKDQANNEALEISDAGKPAARSRSLVRRGLESLLAKQPRVVRFPNDCSIGKLYLRDRNTDDDHMTMMSLGSQLGEARGEVVVPTDKGLLLTINPTTKNLAPLAELRADDLWAIICADAQIDDTWLLPLQGLSGLQMLFLPRCRLGDDGISVLQHLSKLKWLNLAYSQVTDAGLKHLLKLTELETLGLSSALISNAGIQLLTCLSRLQLLSLEGTLIDDEGLASLSLFPDLQFLDLSGTQVSDRGLVHLRKLNKLVWLNLWGTNISQEGMNRLRESLPGCNVDQHRDE